MTAKCGTNTSMLENFYSPFKLHVSEPIACTLAYLSGKKVSSSVVPIAIVTTAAAYATIFCAREALIGGTNMVLEIKNKIVTKTGTTGSSISDTIIKNGFTHFALGSIGAATFGYAAYCGLTAFRASFT